MMLSYRLAYAKQFYGCFRQETSGTKYCSKIAKFLAKTTSHGHRTRDVNNV